MIAKFLICFTVVLLQSIGVTEAAADGRLAEAIPQQHVSNFVPPWTTTFRQEAVQSLEFYLFLFSRVAANAGEPHAQQMLGALYELGTGVARSDAEAVKWYRRAAYAPHCAAHAIASSRLAWRVARGWRRR